MQVLTLSIFFFFNDTATTEIYTLSLHDALPISSNPDFNFKSLRGNAVLRWEYLPGSTLLDRKSTRLNSSHTVISYAVFCLKKKNTNHTLMTGKLENLIPNRPESSRRNLGHISIR